MDGDDHICLRYCFFQLAVGFQGHAGRVDAEFLRQTLRQCFYETLRVLRIQHIGNQYFFETREKCQHGCDLESRLIPRAQYE